MTAVPLLGSAAGITQLAFGRSIDGSRGFHTCATNNPRISVVADEDGLVSVGAIDHANGVPDGRVDLLHHVLHVECDARRRPRAVRRTFDGTNVPGTVDLSTGDTVTFESCEQRQGIFL
jgi:hypothetical protein